MAEYWYNVNTHEVEEDALKALKRMGLTDAQIDESMRDLKMV